ncbi:MAG: RDD family protein [Wolinella sp.]
MQEQLEEIFERERLRVPSLGKRVGAYVIDDILVSLIVTIIIWEKLMINVSNIEAMIMTINEAFLELIAIRFLYQWIFIAKYGSSIGKIFFKMRVVSVDTLDTPSYKDAALRSLVRVASELLFYIPFLTIFAGKFRRAMHDSVAKSVVVSID